MVQTMAKLRMAHAWRTHGARTPPGPMKEEEREQKSVLTIANFLPVVWFKDCIAFDKCIQITGLGENEEATDHQQGGGENEEVL